MVGCTGDCDACFSKLLKDSHQKSMILADGIALEHFKFSKGTVAEQHSHRYDHTTLIAHGSAKITVEGELIGEFQAPHPVFIKAGQKHYFEITSDDTSIFCVHNISRNGFIEVEK